MERTVPIVRSDGVWDSSAAYAIERWTAVVVDDDAVVRKQLARDLHKWKAHVEVTGDADRAFQVLGHTAPTVVLVDLGLDGGACGFQLLERMKADPVRSQLPVAIVTGRAPEGVEPRAGALGVAVVYKPWSEETLLATIREAVLTHHLGRGRLGNTATQEARRVALTPLQCFYLARILQGRSYEALAKETSTTKTNVKSHVQRILRAFDADLGQVGREAKNMRGLTVWFLHRVGGEE